LSATHLPALDAALPLGVLPLVRPVRWFRPWLLGAIYAMVLFPLTAPLSKAVKSGNVLSRYLTIEALVEQETLAVERTPMITKRITRPVDMVRFGEHYYSDKPPVLAVLASPIYGAMFMAGFKFTGMPMVEGRFADVPWDFVYINLAITWLTVGVASAMTLVWLRRIFQTVDVHPVVADLLTLGFGFGSQLLTYGVTFNNHSVAAALITGAMALTLLEKPGSKAWRDRFGVGLLTGFAAVIDLPAGCLMLAGLGLLLAIRARSVPFAFVAGAIGPLLLHCWLQSKVTGTPLPVEMYPEAFVYPGSFWMTPDGTFQEYGPRVFFGLELLLGPPGWLTLTPVLAFGLVGLAMALARRGDPLRPMAGVVLGSLVVLVVYYTFVVRRTDFAGQSFGTRHLLAITPTVYVFAVEALTRLRGRVAPVLFVLLMGVGIFYAYHGVKDPWARIEERELKEPTLKVAQRFLVIYPYSRTRHKFELERAKAAGSTENPAKGRP
jgi:hypothetical protein